MRHVTQHVPADGVLQAVGGDLLEELVAPLADGPGQALLDVGQLGHAIRGPDHASRRAGHQADAAVKAGNVLVDLDKDARRPGRGANGPAAGADNNQPRPRRVVATLLGEKGLG